MDKKKRFVIKTLKMTLAGVVSIFIANLIGLQNSLTTGVVALITITDTRESSFKLAIVRFWSTILAFIIATIVFKILGFKLIAFGIFLIIYIPFANALKLDDGVSNSIVLVTHFIIAESVSMKWQINGFLIMFIGVSVALLINHFSPSYRKSIEDLVVEIEKDFIDIIYKMVDKINKESEDESMSNINSSIRQLKDKIDILKDMAMDEHENGRTYAQYYIDYAIMREEQRKILEIISTLIEQLKLDIVENERLTSIFLETANTFDEDNDVVDLTKSISELYKYFRNSDLPKTRDEFEDRARLFTILSYFESFLELKREFYLNQ